MSDVIFGSRFLCRKKGCTNSKLKVIVEYTKYGSQLKKPSEGHIFAVIDFKSEKIMQFIYRGADIRLFAMIDRNLFSPVIWNVLEMRLK